MTCLLLEFFSGLGGVPAGLPQPVSYVSGNGIETVGAGFEAPRDLLTGTYEKSLFSNIDK